MGTTTTTSTTTSTTTTTTTVKTTAQTTTQKLKDRFDNIEKESEQKNKVWIPEINTCWKCHAASPGDAADDYAINYCKTNGSLSQCRKGDVCMVESRIRNGVTRQVLMGCKQKEACLTQRGNNGSDCKMEGDVKTCRQCCNGYNCAAKTYFNQGSRPHQSRALGADGNEEPYILGTFWFQDLMASDPK